MDSVRVMAGVVFRVRFKIGGRCRSWTGLGYGCSCI